MIAKNSDSSLPEGSKYERLYPQKTPKHPLKRFKKSLSHFLCSLCCIILPPLYKVLMRVVLATSKVDNNFEVVFQSGRAQRKLVAAMWHEDVFMAPPIFRSFKPYTLASTARIGRVVTSILEAHDFQVFRGGTGHSKSGRRRNDVLRSMICFLKREPNAFFGIAVDGTKGPAYKVKPGICKMAQECRVPVFLVHTQAKRALKLPTWDRTVIPLPFNQIRTQLVGPYWICPESSPTEREIFRQHIEKELVRLSSHMAAGFNTGSKQQAKPFIPRKLGNMDLQTDKRPLWAGRKYEKSQTGILTEGDGTLS